MLRVRRVEFQFVDPNPLIPRTSRKTSGVRDPSRVHGRIGVRTLTRLAINLFALLNVILFHCWIKQTGNLMFLRLVHVTSSEDVSHVIEGKDYLPSVSADITHIHIHVYRASVAKKKQPKIECHKKATLRINRSWELLWKLESKVSN